METPDIQSLLKQTVAETLNQRALLDFKLKTFSILETGRILNLHSATVSGLLKRGSLTTTADGDRVPGYSIMNYLKLQEDNIKTLLP